MSTENVIIEQEKVKINSFGLIEEGWQIFKEKWAKILGFFIVAFLVQMLAQASVEIVAKTDESGIFLFVFNLVLMFFNVFISAGLIFGLLKIARREEFAISDLFSQAQLLWRYFLGTTAYGLLVMVGFVLLIVPGVYWALKYWPLTYLLIDKDMKIGEAFKVASKLTVGAKRSVFIFELVALLAMFLGALALGLGLLIAIPVVSIAGALLYNKLATRFEAAQ